MFKSKRPSFKITIAKGALESIFDECDIYDSHETGGRLIGSFQKTGDHLDVKVLGVIGPGPEAQRSAVSFFQDGAYQEGVFRKIEEKHPEVEHLGNWHTHHCNGLATLSHGDHTTYHRIVNHEKHNLDFFYALLVVKKNHGGDPRYHVKHFFFHRSDSHVDEILQNHVQIVDEPVWWANSFERPGAGQRHNAHHQPAPAAIPNAQRVKDQEFFSDFYPSVGAHLSKSAGALYWKGPVRLIDGSHVDIVAIEHPDDATKYSVTLSNPDQKYADVLASYKVRKFDSARHAVVQLRDNLNSLLFEGRKA
jgi:hypothetical protein